MAEAGPSTPLPSRPIVSEDEDQSMFTPAPPESIETPLAPAPNPPASSIPSETPLASKTPTTQPPHDVSEFDPFASSTPQPRSQTSRQADPPPPTQDTGEGERETSGSPAPTEPPFNFSGFLKDLRMRSADPISRYLKSFLSNFAKKPFTVNEQIKLIHDFLAFINDKMRQYEPWKSQSDAEFDNATEAMEKLVMNRLYSYTFTPQFVPTQPITTDDLERDAVFAQRVRLFGWIREKHLDVPEGEASQGFLGFAEQELLKINHYKAPRDKMICILNCCKVIFGLIRHTLGSESTSADAFVPILIFVLLRANPDHMLSNVEYINRFRSPVKLQGEGGYYLSSLTGAIAFIETMDASSLSNVTQEEFEKNVEDAIQEFPPSPTAESSKPSATTPMSPFSPSTPGDEPARQLILPSLGNTRRFFQRTGNTVSEAVSKPLSAIGNIFENMQQGEDEDEQVTPRRRNPRPRTPNSPSRQFAALGLSDSPAPSGIGTPIRDVPTPDFETDELQTTLDMSQGQYEQIRGANIQTLRQMFPAFDEDVVEAVLESCNDDLGTAIDRMLEM